MAFVKTDLRQVKCYTAFVQAELRQAECHMFFVKTDLQQVKCYMDFVETDLRQVKVSESGLGARSLGRCLVLPRMLRSVLGVCRKESYGIPWI